MDNLSRLFAQAFDPLLIAGSLDNFVAVSTLVFI